MRTPSPVALLPLALVVGCSRGPTVVGNNVFRTEERAVSDFHAVSLYGVGTARLSRGEKPSLKVRAEENLLPFVLSEVNGGTLRVGVGPGNYTWHGHPEAEVTAPAVRAIELVGQTGLTAEGLDAESLDVRADGQCQVTAAGKVDSQSVRLSGQSSYTADRLKCRKAAVRCSGQCRAVVAATEELDIDVSGQCHVEYVGKPAKLSVKTAGQSQVVQRQ